MLIDARSVTRRHVEMNMEDYFNKGEWKQCKEKEYHSLYFIKLRFKATEKYDMF